MYLRLIWFGVFIVFGSLSVRADILKYYNSTKTSNDFMCTYNKTEYCVDASSFTTMDEKPGLRSFPTMVEQQGSQTNKGAFGANCTRLITLALPTDFTYEGPNVSHCHALWCVQFQNERWTMDAMSTFILVVSGCFGGVALLLCLCLCLCYICRKRTYNDNEYCRWFRISFCIAQWTAFLNFFVYIPLNYPLLMGRFNNIRHFTGCQCILKDVTFGFPLFAAAYGEFFLYVAFTVATVSLGYVVFNCKCPFSCLTKSKTPPVTVIYIWPDNSGGAG
jgi:hypothetical protein